METCAPVKAWLYIGGVFDSIRFTMSAGSDKIVISQLTKYYGKTLGIQDLTLSIHEGEIFGFLGPNGAGKTTTIRCILNILIPTRGSIQIDDVTVSRDTTYLKDDIGYLPGELYFPKGFTVKNLLDYIASLKNTPCSRREELMQHFGLESHKKIKALSHGNKQKLGIVVAFMHDPSVIVLDEPSSGLDPLLQQKLYDLILEEKARGKTIFFSSHNLDEVQKICDRVAIIRKGNLIAVENVKDLSLKVIRQLKAVIDPMDVSPFQLANLEFTVEDHTVSFPIPTRNTLHTILKILSELEVQDISYPPASLEEYFLLQYD